jgi:hypothetical protein
MMLVPMEPPGRLVNIPPDAVSALSRGRLIDAIKATRVATGLGLKESKEAVEAYLAAHPNVNRQYQEAAALAKGPLRWLVVAIVLVVIVAAVLALSRGQ